MDPMLMRRLPVRLRFNTDPGEGGGGDGGDPNGGGGEYTAPATQADLDRIIEGRLARERKQFEGFDDFKAKAAKWDEHEASGRSDDEKDAAAQQKAIDDAKEAGRAEAAQGYLRERIDDRVRALATEAGFYDADDALSVIDPEALPEKDGKPDDAAIKALVEKRAEQKPHLVAKRPARRPGERGREPKGEPVGGEQKEKGRAAAALRTLGASRRTGS
jgi:hypothetical protein